MGKRIFETVTEEERHAHLLKNRDGLSDSQAAAVAGVRRETICRRRARFDAKMRMLRAACTGEQCPVLEGIGAR
jgi:hypothetical protein